MKLTLSLIAVVFSGNLFAQTVKVTNNDKAAGIREEYYVLKSDKKIREGTYTAYSILGDELICEGFYKNDLKDSVWFYYHFKNRIAENGKYQRGEKTGV